MGDAERDPVPPIDPSPPVVPRPQASASTGPFRTSASANVRGPQDTVQLSGDAQNAIPVSTETRKADGATVETFNDGRKTITQKDGTVINISTEGAATILRPPKQEGDKPPKPQEIPPDPDHGKVVDVMVYGTTVTVQYEDGTKRHGGPLGMSARGG